jgi:hypothetical protein
MKHRKTLLPALFSIALALSLILPMSVGATLAAVPLPDDLSISHSTVDSSSLILTMALNTTQGNVRPMVAAGGAHTVGLRSDGTVVAVGESYAGQCDGSGWTNIVHVFAGYYHTVGLKFEGTVVAVGTGVEFTKWNLGTTTEYTLTIPSAVGGAVIAPGEEAFNYNAGAMVRLVAKPDVGYRFVNWTGDVNTIANANAATTIIAMRGDYSVTADFAINWPLIGGIIAGVVAAGLAIFFVRRKRTARTKGG